MENNEVKFTSDELSEISQLNGEYQSILIEFGQLYLKKIQLETEQTEIKKDESELTIAYDDLKKKDSSLASRIKKKYGEGTADFARGVFLKGVVSENNR